MNHNSYLNNPQLIHKYLDLQVNYRYSNKSSKTLIREDEKKDGTNRYPQEAAKKTQGGHSGTA
jgi:hypothetical protein